MRQELLTSLLSPLNNAKHIPIIIRAKGKPDAIAAVCNAFKPPANRSTDAITPSVTAQNIL